MSLFDNNSSQTLHDACKAGNLDRVHELLGDPQVDVNRLDDQNQTPLHLALHAIAEIDQDYGPNDDDGRVLRIIQVILEHPRFDGNIQDYLSLAWKTGNPTVFELLCKRKDAVGINKQDEFGNTLLHYVLQRPEPLELLRPLVLNANLSVRNDRGLTPFHLAVGLGNLEIVQWMLGRPDSHAFVNLRDKSGETALHCCLTLYGNDGDQKKRYRSILEALIKCRRVNVNIKSPRNGSPFQMAIILNTIDPSLIQLFIDRRDTQLDGLDKHRVSHSFRRILWMIFREGMEEKCKASSRIVGQCTRSCQCFTVD